MIETTYTLEPVALVRHRVTGQVDRQQAAEGAAQALDLVQQLAGARYFALINDRYFRVPFEELIGRSVSELVAVGAAEWKDGTVSNRDL